MHMLQVLFLSIFLEIILLALGQSYDCPSASEATMKIWDDNRMARSEPPISDSIAKCQPSLPVDCSEYQCQGSVTTISLFGCPTTHLLKFGIKWTMVWHWIKKLAYLIHPKNCAHALSIGGFSNGKFPHIFQGCFNGIGAIIQFPQCQWNNLEEYGMIITWPDLSPLYLIR